MKLARSRTNQIITISLLLVILIMLASTTYFIYQNVYQIIILFPQLQQMKAEISFETAKIDTFNQIIKNIDKKTSAEATDWTKIKSPF